MFSSRQIHFRLLYLYDESLSIDIFNLRPDIVQKNSAKLSSQMNLDFYQRMDHDIYLQLSNVYCEYRKLI